MLSPQLQEHLKMPEVQLQGLSPQSAEQVPNQELAEHLTEGISLKVFADFCILGLYFGKLGSGSA
jgi:hypothetical protein